MPPLVKPELLRWAYERAAGSEAELRSKLPKLDRWLSGELEPSLKELEKFASRVRVAIGYLFLPEPPVEKLPIRDLRTVQSQGVAKPSIDLLETIYACQRRQDWYRDYALENYGEPLPFVKSATVATPPAHVAEEMARLIDFGPEVREDFATTDDAIREFIDRTEDAGVLVMISSIVGNYSRRGLNVNEFRGFALVDDYAPVVFVNGADAPAAKMFTLAHELAHLWLGESALSNFPMSTSQASGIEQWCNGVAAEFLVPMSKLSKFIDAGETDASVLARKFKVSRLVILRRQYDLGVIGREELELAYTSELARAKQKDKPEKKKGGPSFSTLLRRRVSQRFARAVIYSAREGATPYRDAFSLLGVKNEASFKSLAEKVGLNT